MFGLLSPPTSALVRFRPHCCPSKLQTAYLTYCLHLSPPTIALVRFRLHAWPTASTYLCPPNDTCKAHGRCARERWRVVEFCELCHSSYAADTGPINSKRFSRAVSPLDCDSVATNLVQTAYLAYCVHLPVPSLVRFRLHTWPTVSAYLC
jgi:hypothetical protein